MDLEKEVFNLVGECRKYLLEQETRLLNKIMKNNSVDMTDVRNVLDKYLTSKGIEKEVREKTLDKFETYILRYGEIDELIADPTISDIKVLSKDNIRIKRLGKRETSNVKFASEEDFRNFANLVAVKNQVNVSNINAIQIVTDKTTYDSDILRINISSPYINSTDAPYVYFRKIPKNKRSLDELEKLGMFTREEKEYIVRLIKEGKSIIFTGKGASGKTTIMNTLLDEIGHDRSALVIQESEELFSNNHPDMMFQTVKQNKGESKVNYSLKDLAINGLLVDLDCFVIGEIKGGEALYFLNASYTGHSCYASVHGNNSQLALNKLADYVKYESDYSREDILKMLSEIDAVIFMKNFQVKEISETNGFNHERKEIMYNKVFENHKRLNQSCKIEEKLCV